MAARIQYQTQPSNSVEEKQEEEEEEKKKEDRNKEEEEEKKTTVKEITLQLSNIVDNFFMLPLDFWKEFPLEEIVAGEGKDIQISVTGQRYLFKVMIHPMSFSLMRK